MLLLALAAELFIDRGYEAVSMQDIADRAELTKGALYGHFRSKGQLLVEVLRWRQADVDERSDFQDLTFERGIRLLGARRAANCGASRSTPQPPLVTTMRSPPGWRSSIANVRR